MALVVDPVLINGFYERLLHLKQEYGIVDNDIYDFDETGFTMGIGATAKVICSSDRSGKPSLIQPGNREWVAVVECAGSSDVVVPPLIIFKSKHNQAEWYTDPILPPVLSHDMRGGDQWRKVW